MSLIWFAVSKRTGKDYDEKINNNAFEVIALHE